MAQGTSVTTKVHITTHDVPQYTVGHDMYFGSDRSNGNHWAISLNKRLKVSHMTDSSNVTESKILSN